jgi:hypothetical protein
MEILNFTHITNSWVLSKIFIEPGDLGCSGPRSYVQSVNILNIIILALFLSIYLSLRLLIGLLEINIVISGACMSLRILSSWCDSIFRSSESAQFLWGADSSSGAIACDFAHSKDLSLALENKSSSLLAWQYAMIISKRSSKISLLNCWLQSLRTCHKYIRVFN